MPTVCWHLAISVIQHSTVSVVKNSTSFFLEDFNEAGVDVAGSLPVELFRRVLVHGAPATALCCSASSSPGSSDVGSADMFPG